MKKTAIFLAVMLILSIFVMSSCDLVNKIPGLGDLIGGDKPCTEHVDENGDYICDNCEAELEKNDTPNDTPCEHKDENKDHKCDECEENVGEHKAADGSHDCGYCGVAMSECAAAEGSHNCSVCGDKLSDCAAAEGSHNCSVCGDKLSDCVAAEGSHNCSVCGEKVSDCTPAEGSHDCAVCGQAIPCFDKTGDFYCDICDKDILPENHERVSYSMNISDHTAGTLSADLISSMFTVVSGSEIRNRTKSYDGVEYQRSVKIGNSTTKIKVSAPGTGILSFLVQNGSSGAATQFITVTAPDGSVQDIEFVGTDAGSPVVKISVVVTEGDWIISRGKNGGTQDIFFLELACGVELSPENGFKIASEGRVDYLCGQELDLSGLVLQSTFENGKVEPLTHDSVEIDTSLVNMGVSGTYAITIKYKEYEPITYNVNVYTPTEVILGYDAVEKLASNSAAGNGVYFNHSVKEVYKVGQELDLTGLSVIVKGTLGENSKEFKINNYVLSDVDLSTAGTKEMTVDYVYGENKVSTTLTLHVIDVNYAIVKDAYQVKVDDSYEGEIGAIADGYNCFKTVQQALDFLADTDPAKRKIMVIEEGYYWEKLEITIPNLHIIGAGADKVTIEWDSLYGLIDAGGFTHTTDSTATVAIREQATGVIIEGVTISNYWNSQDRMTEAGLAIERGLALLVQSDRFIMKNSALLGIQDTLELFTGRQYFENVFISGYTDFIFGTNNTTYFKNCTVHVIDTEKDDNGTAGYLTAFKGSNKGASDSIVYGAIFDGCKFTADEGVSEGMTAIGRTWGAYAAVAVINSELGAHISVDGYDKAENKNKRYISMNGVHPTDETVQFVEYNNTGAGAITEAVAGMRFLTAEEAANYADFAIIFGINNGKVSYLDPWDPNNTEIPVDDRTYYYFNDKAGTSGTSHTFDTATSIAKGSTLEWAGLLISAEQGNVAWNQNGGALNMKQGAFIKFTVPAGSMVTVETYPNYSHFTLNGVGTSSANMLSRYFAEETEVVLLSTGDLYLYSIIINPGEEAPAAPTLNEIKASGMNTNYVVGDELSLEGLSVKAYYSDNSVVELVDYTLDSTAVNNTAAGEYELLFTYEGKTASIMVTYENPNSDPAITTDTILDFSTPAGLEAVQNNPRVTIDGSVRHNGAEIQISGTISFKVKAGTAVSVVPYSNSQYVSYKIYAEGETTDIVYDSMQSVMFFEDCTVIYEGLSNNYLVSISIECPLGEGKYVFGGSSEEGDVTGILESIPGMSVTGTCKTHSGGAQLSSDSQIIFIAPALATITVKGFDTNYGQLLVIVDGVPVEMNDKAQYVFTPTYAATVMIEAINVGTEEAPDWSKSYITYIDVAVPVYIEETTNITFGSEGNYKDSVVDFSGITIGDNGGNNSQIKNGSFSFAVRKGAVVTVHGYSGYTSYNLSDGDITFENITDKYFTYEASADCLITITPVSGNNYFYSFEVKYPAGKENVSISFGSEGNYHEANSAVDLSGVQIGDNGGSNSQVKNGSITVTLFAGGRLTIKGYSGYTDYTLSDGTSSVVVNAETENHTGYTYTAAEDVTVTITPNSGNNYFYGIDITY